MTLTGNFIQYEEVLFNLQTLCRFSKWQHLREDSGVLYLPGAAQTSRDRLWVSPGNPSEVRVISVHVSLRNTKDDWTPVKGLGRCPQASTSQKTKVFCLQRLFSFAICVQWEELHIYAVIAGIIVYDEWSIQINFSFTPTIT